jgi:hypothetical protein
MFPIFLYGYLLFGAVWDVLALPLQALLELTVVGSWVLDAIGVIMAVFFKSLHFMTYGWAQKRIKNELIAEIKALEKSLPPSQKYMAKQVEALLNEVDKLFDGFKKKIMGAFFKSLGSLVVELVPVLGTISPTWTADALMQISSYNSEQDKIKQLKNKVKSLSIFVSKQAKANLKRELAMKRRIMQIAGVMQSNQQIETSTNLQSDEVRRSRNVLRGTSLQSKDRDVFDSMIQQNPAVMGKVLEEELDNMDYAQMELIDQSLGGGMFLGSTPRTQKAYQKAIQTQNSRMAISNNVQSGLDSKRQQAQDLVDAKRIQSGSQFQSKRDRVDSQLEAKRQYAKVSTDIKSNYVEEMREAQNMAAKAVAESIRAKKA